MTKIKRAQRGKKRSRPKPQTRRLIEIELPAGLPSITDIEDELDEMLDVLMGREDPPISKGIITLQEVSTAYLARALELTLLIHQGERSGDITKGSDYYHLRTGELRDFIDLAKRSAELGSRRITAAQLRADLDSDDAEAQDLEV